MHVGMTAVGLFLGAPLAALAQGSGSEQATRSLVVETRAAIERALQDEYHAEAIYERVIEDFGETRPFSNVVNAERRHSASLERLLTKRSLSVPANQWSDTEGVPRFSSLLAACQAATVAERDNVALYDEVLETELPDDVKRVFSHNRAASYERHLPAFERCSSRDGRGREGQP